MDFLNVDNRFIKEVYEDEEYKKYLKDFDIPKPKKGQPMFNTVVDLGSNIGMFSFWLKDRAKEIYGMDIDKEAVEIAKAIAEKNGIKNILFEHLGVSDRNGEAWLDIDRGGVPTQGGMRLSHIPHRTAPSVKITTLRQFLVTRKIKKVDLLKVDLEGGEKDLFAPKDFFVSRIPRIVGEYHQHSPIKRLEELGYIVKDYQNTRHFTARRKYE